MRGRRRSGAGAGTEPSAMALGGQAVPGGVMIRTRGRWAVAVRTPSGSIEATAAAVGRGWRRCDAMPVVRGVVALAETVTLGLRALTWATERTEDAAPRRVRPAVVGVVVFAVAALAFAAGPAIAASWLVDRWSSAPPAALVEALLRLAGFLGYVAGIGCLSGIQEVFAYHGAEHKAIAAAEAGQPLEIGSVQRLSRHHARCGTDFLLLVVAVGIVAFAAVPARSIPHAVVSRGLLLPLVAGLAYEVLVLARRHPANPVVRALVAPGIALQRLTTREPSDAQVEVAIAALRHAGGGSLEAHVSAGGADRDDMGPAGTASGRAS